ncbi:MAG: nucleoside triphosphate pyrophosphohydrolase [Clostridiales bacterium]|nr:nucleoside triphosphate pyrophosphohydrolase [Clostridiales bacterium]
MISFESSEQYDVYDLVRLIKILRSPEGCPWDREQTHASIRRNFLEEAYEAVEAIDEDDPLHMCEEFGDVLTQIVFHSGIEEDAGRFTFGDVADTVVRKLLYRHPHIFGDAAAETSDEVLVNWDELKRIEKGQETTADTLTAVANSLPALWRAEKVQKKAAKVGFDWSDVRGAFEKLREEMDELDEAISAGDYDNAALELGDVLFTAVNVGRFIGADPEMALGRTTETFIARFAKMEQLITAAGKSMDALPPGELDEWYNRAKALV